MLETDTKHTTLAVYMRKERERIAKLAVPIVLGTENCRSSQLKQLKLNQKSTSKPTSKDSI
jgi:hypothetical protein